MPIIQGFSRSEDSGRVRCIPDASGNVEGLKICRTQVRGGSSPFRGTKLKHINGFEVLHLKAVFVYAHKTPKKVFTQNLPCPKSLYLKKSSAYKKLNFARQEESACPEFKIACLTNLPLPYLREPFTPLARTIS